MRGLKPLTPAGARRRTEALLLALTVGITALGHASAGLALNGALPVDLAAFTADMSLLALVAHLGVRRFAAYADPLVLPLALLLTGLGLVLLHRLDHAYVEQFGGDAYAPGQLLWTVVGVAACLLVLALLRDHRRLQRFIYLPMAAALALLAAPAFSPADTYGAKRWIVVGGMSVQPGEFVKIMIAVFFAGYLVVHREALALTGRRFLGMRLPPMRRLGPIATVWILSLLVLVFERDLGTSLIFFGVFVVMLYVATERTGWIVCGLVMAAGGAFAVGSTEPHVKARVAAWLDPLSYYREQPPPGVTSDQAAQALFGFGSGGMSGTGLGRGHPELIKFAGRSDFILTTVGEELGLAGVMAVLLLYALLVQRGLRMALGARDPFGKLLAVGLSAALALQVFVVAGGVTGLIPLTGKALPFLAKGGSSLLANWIMVALLLRISDGAERQREAGRRRPAAAAARPAYARPARAVPGR
ncbi:MULTISPECIES: FtsW/RodA/SpoVE family cell cycle protein [Streptomyces]|uniref:FtsW/RodA/SpoVE family cell cycle protein n=1 Tax=Streptomyces TaxID=1883 RepID=UPI001673E6BC|nr:MULTISPECIES: FtsW/RodA/SpoVE family cell cycle protein [Streptomyces]MBD3577117.1 FtsW/RodA/SpoVE family cell cycle protein [Streptomyces sp. KD18]GGS87275.1 cell division protein FtsW [Streptomyces toxytricini]